MASFVLGIQPVPQSSMWRRWSHHNGRTPDYGPSCSWIDPEKTCRNEMLWPPPPPESGPDPHQYLREHPSGAALRMAKEVFSHYEEHNAAVKKAWTEKGLAPPRQGRTPGTWFVTNPKGKSLTLELVIGPGKDVVLSSEEEKAFFRDALEWAKEEYGEENLLQAAVHRDEARPHMHLAVFARVRISEFGRTWDRVDTRRHMDKFHLEALRHSFLDKVACRYGMKEYELSPEQKLLCKGASPARFREIADELQAEQLAREHRVLKQRQKTEQEMAQIRDQRRGTEFLLKEAELRLSQRQEQTREMDQLLTQYAFDYVIPPRKPHFLIPQQIPAMLGLSKRPETAQEWTARTEDAWRSWVSREIMPALKAARTAGQMFRTNQDLSEQNRNLQTRAEIFGWALALATASDTCELPENLAEFSRNFRENLWKNEEERQALLFVCRALLPYAEKMPEKSPELQEALQCIRHREEELALAVQKEKSKEEAAEKEKGPVIEMTR